MASITLCQMGCLAHLGVSSESTEKLTERYQGKTLWLKYSLYAGQFYDNPHLGLLAERPFHKLDLVHNLDGEPVYPPHQEDSISMGTAVIVDRIEWPTLYQQVKRPLLSPRSLPWVYVRLGRTRGHTSFLRDRTYVLFAPPTVTTQDEMAKWLDGIMSADDTNVWLLEQGPNVVAAISKKEPLLGMNAVQLSHAMGKPLSLSRSKKEIDGKMVTVEIAQYDTCKVTLQDGTVIAKGG